LRLLRRRRLVEAGAASFAAVSIERELGDDQQAASGFLHVAIHFSGLIRKDPETQKLFDEIVRIRGSVGPGDAQEDEQPRTYSPGGTFIHNYPSFLYTLNDQSHAIQGKFSF
jgi:hypothetical protein